MRQIPDEIRVRLATHEATGLMIATSPDVPGLIVHGRNRAEIDARIPEAVRALVAADKKLAEKQARGLPRGFAIQDSYSLEVAA
jgi:hypothetical protein